MRVTLRIAFVGVSFRDRNGHQYHVAKLASVMIERERGLRPKRRRSEGA